MNEALQVKYIETYPPKARIIAKLANGLSATVCVVEWSVNGFRVDVRHNERLSAADARVVGEAMVAAAEICEAWQQERDHLEAERARVLDKPLTHVVTADKLLDAEKTASPSSDKAEPVQEATKGYDPLEDGDAPFELNALKTARGVLVVSPGSGALTAEHSEENADKNIVEFMKELAFPSLAALREPKGDEGGRYAYKLLLESRSCEVLMPGLPLEKVRFVGDPDQNVWHFPRLFIDGESWLWKFAINVTRDALNGAYDDDEE